MTCSQPRELLTAMFEAVVDAAQPARCVPAALPAPPSGRTVVIGAGKAAAAMASAVEDSWSGDFAGLVVTRYGHGVATRSIDVVEAAHPVPDQASRDAARRILAMVEPLGADDLALCLISGGGSALLSLPAPGLSLADKQAVTRDLLRSGAAISEINCLRKHLSAVKGGQLAVAAAPARICALVISDVPGDVRRHDAVVGEGGDGSAQDGLAPAHDHDTPAVQPDAARDAETYAGAAAGYQRYLAGEEGGVEGG